MLCTLVLIEQNDLSIICREASALVLKLPGRLQNQFVKDALATADRSLAGKGGLCQRHCCQQGGYGQHEQLGSKLFERYSVHLKSLLGVKEGSWRWGIPPGMNRYMHVSPRAQCLF